MPGSQTLTEIWHEVVHGAATLCKGAWDQVTRNSARVERGMEKASLEISTIIGLGALDGCSAAGIFREDGWTGLAYLAFFTAAAGIGLLHMKSRVEISQFDKKKQEEYAAAAVNFYEAHKHDAPHAS